MAASDGAARGCLIWALQLERIRGGSQACDLRRDITALDQFVVALNHLELRLFALAQEADVELACPRAGLARLDRAATSEGRDRRRAYCAAAADMAVGTAIRKAIPRRHAAVAGNLRSI